MIFFGADSRRKRDNAQPSDAANSPELTDYRRLQLLRLCVEGKRMKMTGFKNT